MVDLKRRGFLFGAVVALAVPPVRTFHLLPKMPTLPWVIVPPFTPVWDSLPEELQKAQTMAAILIRGIIDRQTIEAINSDDRWAVISKENYEILTGAAHGQRRS